ncbi:MAG: alkylation response protein AidB-like acyl-CoA dehydrogenase [Saprospiraceae bacterium]|jgi:alkylation response protein AidB-like acyl-CoA dehydrogenase
MEDTVVKVATLKGGEFLIKETDPQSVFIPEDMTEEQQMVLEMCRDFIKNEVHPVAPKIENQVPLLEKAAELGLLSSHIPEVYGGMEMDNNTNTIILDGLGGAGGSFTTSYAAHTGIGMLPILYYGTEEQKQKYLPGLGNGQLKASYCLTEPGSGSDALAAKTRADLTEDGKHYIINGQKMWITNAGFSHVLIVFAQVNGEYFTGFVVDKDTEGITLGAEEDKMGIKGSSTRQVFFENVKVPADTVLGEIGKGHLIAFNILNVGRFKLGALCAGGMKQAITESVKYANDRIQFKQPISNFGAIKYKLAEQVIKTYTLESAVLRVSNLMQKMRNDLKEQGVSYSDSLLQSAEEYAIECGLLKVLGSENLDYVVDEMVQIHGGNGFSEEYAAAPSYRDARINRIYEGTNEINRMLMVNMLLKRAMKGKINITDAAWAVQKELSSMPSFDVVDGDFAVEQKAVKNFKKVALIVAGAAVKYQMDGRLDLRVEQEILMNIADIMIQLYAAESVLLRVQKLSTLKSTDEIATQIAMMKVVFNDANDAIAKFSKDALSSFAEGDELSIMLMGVKRFTKLAPVNVKNARRQVAKELIEANEYCF